MSYWSIVCIATSDVHVPQANLVLEPGVNVFTVVTDDVESFSRGLSASGVEIRSIHCLDDFEPIPALEEGELLNDGSEAGQGETLRLRVEN